MNVSDGVIALYCRVEIMVSFSSILSTPRNTCTILESPGVTHNLPPQEGSILSNVKVRLNQSKMKHEFTTCALAYFKNVMHSMHERWTLFCILFLTPASHQAGGAITEYITFSLEKPCSFRLGLFCWGSQS